MKLDKKTLEKIKKVVASAKSKKAIKSHIEAFKECPVSCEEHKGRKKYFTN